MMYSGAVMYPPGVQPPTAMVSNHYPYMPEQSYAPMQTQQAPTYQYPTYNQKPKQSRRKKVKKGSHTQQGFTSVQPQQPVFTQPNQVIQPNFNQYVQPNSNVYYGSEGQYPGVVTVGSDPSLSMNVNYGNQYLPPSTMPQAVHQQPNYSFQIPQANSVDSITQAKTEFSLYSVLNERSPKAHHQKQPTYGQASSAKPMPVLTPNFSYNTQGQYNQPAQFTSKPYEPPQSSKFIPPNQNYQPVRQPQFNSNPGIVQPVFTQPEVIQPPKVISLSQMLNDGSQQKPNSKQYNQPEKTNYASHQSKEPYKPYYPQEQRSAPLPPKIYEPPKQFEPYRPEPQIPVLAEKVVEPPKPVVLPPTVQVKEPFTVTPNNIDYTIKVPKPPGVIKSFDDYLPPGTSLPQASVVVPPPVTILPPTGPVLDEPQAIHKSDVIKPIDAIDVVKNPEEEKRRLEEAIRAKREKRAARKAAKKAEAREKAMRKDMPVIEKRNTEKILISRSSDPVEDRQNDYSQSDKSDNNDYSQSDKSDGDDDDLFWGGIKIEPPSQPQPVKVTRPDPKIEKPHDAPHINIDIVPQQELFPSLSSMDIKRTSEGYWIEKRLRDYNATGNIPQLAETIARSSRKVMISHFIPIAGQTNAEAIVANFERVFGSIKE